MSALVPTYKVMVTYIGIAGIGNDLMRGFLNVSYNELKD